MEQIKVSVCKTEEYKYFLFLSSDDVNSVLEKIVKLSEHTVKNINNCIAQHQLERPLETNTDYLTNNLSELNEAFKAASFSQVVKHLKENKTKFSEETLAKLNRGSPTSLTLTFAQLRLGTTSYKEALELDYR